MRTTVTVLLCLCLLSSTTSRATKEEKIPGFQCSLQVLLFGFVVGGALFAITAPSIRKMLSDRNNTASLRSNLDSRELDDAVFTQIAQEARVRLEKKYHYNRAPIEEYAPVQNVPLFRLLKEYASETDELSAGFQKLNLQHHRFELSEYTATKIDDFLRLAVQHEWERHREYGRTLSADELLNAVVNKADESMHQLSLESRLSWNVIPLLGIRYNKEDFSFITFRQAAALRRRMENDPVLREQIRSSLNSHMANDATFAGSVASTASAYSNVPPAAALKSAKAFDKFLGNMDEGHRSSANRPLSPDELEEHRNLVEGWLLDRMRLAYQNALDRGVKLEDITIRRLFKDAFGLDLSNEPALSPEEFETQFFKRQINTGGY